MAFRLLGHDRIPTPPQMLRLSPGRKGKDASQQRFVPKSDSGSSSPSSLSSSPSSSSSPCLDSCHVCSMSGTIETFMKDQKQSGKEKERFELEAKKAKKLIMPEGFFIQGRYVSTELEAAKEEDGEEKSRAKEDARVYFRCLLATVMPVFYRRMLATMEQAELQEMLHNIKQLSVKRLLTLAPGEISIAQQMESAWEWKSLHECLEQDLKLDVLEWVLRTCLSTQTYLACLLWDPAREREAKLGLVIEELQFAERWSVPRLLGRYILNRAGQTYAREKRLHTVEMGKRVMIVLKGLLRKALMASSQPASSSDMLLHDLDLLVGRYIMASCASLCDEFAQYEQSDDKDKERVLNTLLEVRKIDHLTIQTSDNTDPDLGVAMWYIASIGTPLAISLQQREEPSSSSSSSSTAVALIFPVLGRVCANAERPPPISPREGSKGDSSLPRGLQPVPTMFPMMRYVLNEVDSKSHLAQFFPALHASTDASRTRQMQTAYTELRAKGLSSLFTSHGMSLSDARAFVDKKFKPLLGERHLNLKELRGDGIEIVPLPVLSAASVWQPLATQVKQVAAYCRDLLLVKASVEKALWPEQAERVFRVGLKPALQLFRAFDDIDFVRSVWKRNRMLLGSVILCKSGYQRPLTFPEISSQHMQAVCDPCLQQLNLRVITDAIFKSRQNRVNHKNLSFCADLTSDCSRLVILTDTEKWFSPS